jgi:isoamylase
MTSEDWNTGFAESLGVFLNGDSLPDPDRRGYRISDDSFLLLFTTHYEDVKFVLPNGPWGEQWLLDFDTAVVPMPSEPQPTGTKVVVAVCDVQIFWRV